MNLERGINPLCLSIIESNCVSNEIPVIRFDIIANSFNTYITNVTKYNENGRHIIPK